jgi:hypothetical protein
MMYRTFTYYGIKHSSDGFRVAVSYVRADSFAAARARARRLLWAAKPLDLDHDLYQYTISYQVPGVSVERFGGIEYHQPGRLG